MAALLLLFVTPTNATIYLFENTTSGTVNETVTPCSNPLIRTISVGPSITITEVSLGITIDHTYRGDLDILLESPEGTRVTIVDGFQADSNNNFDAVFSDASPIAMDDGRNDPTTSPFFDRHADPDNAFSAFDTEDASGDWTIEICDTAGGDSGTFQRARLIIEDSSSITAVCDSKVTYDWADNGDQSSFTSSTTNDITLTESNTTDPDNVEAGDNFETLIETRGNEPDFYSLEMNTGNVLDRGMTVEFDFDPPVYDLEFSLLDVDQAGWDDLMRIDAVDAAGNLLPYDATIVNDVEQIGDLFDGDTPNVANNDDDGNVDYFVGGPVTTLTVVYLIGNDSGTAFQWSGVSDPSFCGYDFGDAPDSYDTDLSGGARHDLEDRDLFFGSNPPDGEDDGQPGVNANDDGIDEDALSTFPGQDLDPGDTYSVDLTVTNNSGGAATVCGWIDFDIDGQAGDGSFQSDEGDCVGTGSCTGTGPLTCTLDFTVPADFVFVADEPTYARFRVSTAALTTSSISGRAQDGEVEDFRVAPNTLPVTVNWLTSRRHGDGLLLDWQTASETNNAGFQVWGWTGKSSQLLGFVAVAEGRTTAMMPSNYRIKLSALELPPGVDAISIKAVSTRGIEDEFGPYALGATFGQRIERHRKTHSKQLSVLGSESMGSASYVNVLTATEGMHRITHQDLLDHGLDLIGSDPSFIVVTLQGEPVARHIQTLSGSWDTLSTIDFYADPLGPVAALYSANNVYRVETVQDSGPRNDSVSVKGRPLSVVGHHNSLLWYGDDKQYSFGQPNGDPFYDRAIQSNGSPVSAQLPMVVDHWSGSGPVRLFLDLVGVTDWPGNTPDHRIDIYFDGVFAGARENDGQVEWTVDLPVVLNASGPHTAEVVVTGDTGNAFDLINVNRWGLQYRRDSVSVDDRLLFAANSGGQRVAGFSSANIVAYARAGDDLRHLEVFPLAEGGGTFSAEFSLETVIQDPAHVFGNGFEWASEQPQKATTTSVDVWASTEDALYRPEFSAGVLDAELPEPGTDLVIIVPTAWIPALQDYVDFRSAEGWQIHVASVEEIVAGFGHGLATPDAVRSYLKAARGGGYQAVLLVGAATLDPLNRLGTGVENLIPVPYVRSHDLIYFTPFDGGLVDFDGDGIPDSSLGRWPVSDLTELAAMIQKTLAYSAQNPVILNGVVIADTVPQHEQQMETLSQQMADQIPIDFDAIYLSGFGTDPAAIALARQALLDSIDAGRSLALYAGHGSPTSWSFEGMLDVQAAGLLNNGGSPTLAMPLSCYTTYFVAENQNTLSHELLIRGVHGAAAVIGPATLSRLTANERMASAVLEHLSQGQTLGLALMNAKRQFADRQGMRDAIANWTLLGDPLLRFPIQATQMAQ